LLMLALTAGCAAPGSSVHWFREDVHPVAVQGDRHLDYVKIWSGVRTFEWRDVLVTSDSIRGTPVQCDSCRFALPTTAVDSLDVGYTHGGSGSGARDDAHDTSWWEPLLILAFLLVP